MIVCRAQRGARATTVKKHATLVAVLLLCIGPLRADTLLWSNVGLNDINGQALFPPLGGSGTWSFSGTNWLGAGGGYVAWPNAATSVAVFGAAPGTVTLGADGIVAGGLTFNTPGYILEGGGHTLTLAGAAPAITTASNVNAAITAPLAATGILNLGGEGVLTLSAGGTLGGMSLSQGTTNLQGGTWNLTDPSLPLSLTGDAALRLSGGAVLNATGTTEVIQSPLGAQISLTGAGTTLHTGTQLLIGNNGGGGELSLGLGATLVGDDLVIVGTHNQGILTASQGAAISNFQTILGLYPGASGQATVDGSTWNTGVLSLGGVDSANRGGSGTLIMTGGAAMNVAGATTLFGNNSQIEINQAQLTTGLLSSFNHDTTGFLQIADPPNGSALVIDDATAGHTADFSGTIAGGGSVLKTGASIQTLSGANTFFGATIINGGSIVAGNPLALQGSTVNINVDGGLNLNGLPAATLGGLAGSGALNLGATALTVGANSESSTYSGALGATTGSLTKTGVGTLTLTGGVSVDALTVSGGAVAVRGGTLTLTDPQLPLFVGGTALLASLMASGGTTINATGQTSVIDSLGSVLTDHGTVLNTGFQFLVGNHSQSSLTVEAGARVQAGTDLIVGANAGGTVDVLTGAHVNAPQAILGFNPAGSGVINVIGPGSQLNTLNLTFGGELGTVLGGTGQLNIQNGGVATAEILAQFFTSGSSINIDGGTLNAAILSSSGAVGSINLVSDPAGGSALNITGHGISGEYAGTITGTGSLSKSGIAVQTLSGVNPLAGDTFITGGSIALGNALALENSTVHINVDGGLNLNGLPAASIGGLAGPGALALGSTSLTVGSNGQGTTYSGALSGAGNFNKTGPGTLTMTTGGNVAGLFVGAGTLVLQSGASLKAGATTSEVEGNAALLTVTGAGTELQTGFQFLVGNHIGGTLQVANGGAVNGQFLVVGVNVPGNLTISGGGNVVDTAAALSLNPGGAGFATVTGPGSLWSNQNLGIGGFSASQKGGFGVLSILDGGAVTVSGTTQFFTSGSAISISGGSLTTGMLASAGGGNAIDLVSDPAGAHALTINGAGMTGTFADSITGAGSVLIDAPGGTQTFTGSNSYTGATLVNSGTLIQSGGSSTSPVTVANGALYFLTGAANLNLSGGSITAQAGGQVRYQDAAVSGAVLTGGGTHLVSFDDSLKINGGPLELNSGTLVNNGAVQGTLDINAGSVAEGVGVYDVVNLNSGGTLHPGGSAGSSPGLLRSTSATWADGGIFQFDIVDALGAPGVDWSLWDLQGLLQLQPGARTIVVDAAGPLLDFDHAKSYLWTFAVAQSIQGFSSPGFTVNQSLAANGSFSVVSDGQSLALEFTPAPEPETIGLVGGALLLLAAARRARGRSPRNAGPDARAGGGSPATAVDGQAF